MRKRMCVTLLVAVVFLVGSTAAAAVLGPQVEYGNYTYTSTTVPPGGGSWTIYGFTVGAHDRRMLLVGVAMKGTAGLDVVSVTFGGSAMNPLVKTGEASYSSGGSAKKGCAKWYYLALGDGASPDTRAITLTFNNKVDTFSAVAIGLYDAAQGTPGFGASVVGYPSFPTSNQVCVTPTANNALLVDLVAWGDPAEATNPTLYLPGGSSAVKLWGGTMSGYAIGAGATLAVATPSAPHCITWNSTIAGPVAHAIVAVENAAPSNTAPVANADSYTTDEDTTLTVPAATPPPYGVLHNDTDAESDPLTAVLDTDVSHGTLTLNSDGSFTYVPDENWNGEDSFTYHANDGALDSNTVTVTITVNAVNDAPVISSPTNASPATRTVQYSDPITKVTITATDVDSTELTATISDDLGGGLSVGNKQCTPDGSGGTTCTWDVTGKALDPSGEADIDVTVTDGEDPTTEADAIIITVHCEDASAALDGDNPVAEQVSDPGGDLDTVDLHLSVWETVTFDDPDWIEPSGTYADPGYPGNINLTDLDGVTMTLTPVGPGSPITVTCDQDAAVATDSYVSTDYTCTFTDVPVNTYTVTAAVGGGDTCTTGDYYFGVSGEDVFTVFDPSLGYTTGGGWFYWPGTDEIDYPGDKTNFGFTMKYNKKATNIQGSLLMIRHLADGTIYRVKSNALGGLAVGEDTDWGWASFAGKATYMEPGEEAVGNYTFITYVEDHGEPGHLADSFWIEVQDKDGVVAPAVSLDRQAGDNAELIEGGNIVVPHTPSRKN